DGLLETVVQSGSLDSAAGPASRRQNGGRKGENRTPQRPPGSANGGVKPATRRGAVRGPQAPCGSQVGRCPPASSPRPANGFENRLGPARRRPKIPGGKARAVPAIGGRGGDQGPHSGRKSQGRFSGQADRQPQGPAALVRHNS